jgi:hypothetical protein
MGLYFNVILVILCLIFRFSGYSGQPDGPVILFDRDTIDAVIGNVAVLRLKLNKSEGIVIDSNCYIDIESDSNLELAGNKIISNLPQNENIRYFPVNILIPQTALQSKLYEINASLINGRGDTISQAKLFYLLFQILY